MELIFIFGGEITKFKIEGKKIHIWGKGSNHQWAPWDPLGLSALDLSQLRQKYGEKWYRDYLKSEDKFRAMETEEEIAKDLIKDYKKIGWRLIKKE